MSDKGLLGTCLTQWEPGVNVARMEYSFIKLTPPPKKKKKKERKETSSHCIQQYFRMQHVVIQCVPVNRKPVLSVRYLHCHSRLNQTICFIIKGIFSSFIWYQTHDDISMHDWNKRFKLMHVKIDLCRIIVLSWYDQGQTSYSMSE